MVEVCCWLVGVLFWFSSGGLEVWRVPHINQSEQNGVMERQSKEKDNQGECDAEDFGENKFPTAVNISSL